jgi:glycosyltransferase involved in cell wall biosynthesis
MYKNKTVGIVFPAYNEESGIKEAVQDFKAQEAVDKVYVIDNNSKDKTAELAKEAGAIVIGEPKQGYGSALRRGLKECDCDLVVLCEPDGTFVARDIEKILSYSSDFAMVMGTRTTRELIWHRANMGQFLRIGNWVVGKSLAFLFNGPSISDCGCTFRMIQRELLDKMNPHLKVNKSHFLPEMVCLALLMHASIIEIPLNYKGRLGESKITGTLKGTLKTGFAMIFLIIKYRLLGWFGLKKKLGKAPTIPAQVEREPH